MKRLEYVVVLLSAFLIDSTSSLAYWWETDRRETFNPTSESPPGLAKGRTSVLGAYRWETDRRETFNPTSESPPGLAKGRTSVLGDDLEFQEPHGTEEGKQGSCAILCGNSRQLSMDDVTENLLSKCTRPAKFPLCDLCPGKYFECSYVDDNWRSTFQLEHFTCPPETVFNVSAQNCLPERQNVSTIVSWQMEDVISSAKDVCKLIQSIDVYDDTTITTLPLRRGLAHQRKLNAYVTKYNRDLEVAQSHMRVWRKGKSIVDDIRKTYNKAKGYENTFDRMHNTNIGRMETMEINSIRLTKSLKENIKDLKADIERMENQPAAEDPVFQTYMQDILSDKKGDLVEKEARLSATTPTALKLAEMLQFIGYVRTHTSDVVALATTSSKRIDQLYENIISITNTFSNHSAEAEKDREGLMKEEQRLNTRVQDNHRNINNLNNKKVELDAVKYDFIDASDEVYKLMESLSENILRNRPSLKRFKSSLGESLRITLGICDDSRDRQTRIDTLTEQLSPHHTEIDDQMRRLSGEIHRWEVRIQKIQFEKLAFDMFISDLQKMAHGITSVQEDLKELVKMTRKVETVFQHVNTDLGKMIDQSQAPKTESERDMALEKIIEDLDLHQLRIDQSSEEIVNMRECTLLSSALVL